MMGFLERVGAALVAPRHALAIADTGRGGAGDLAILLALDFLATETRAIVAALWTIVVASPMAGLQALLAHMNSALGEDLVLWLGAGVLITVLAGGRRSPGRDFDLAAVAWVPFLAIHLVGSLALSLGWHPAGWAIEALRVVALAWMGGLVILAILHARRRPQEAAA